MIEKRLVQWFAADSGVDLDIAEREVALTYVLRTLADAGWLSRLAFKGGTAIRKLHLPGPARFSLDLDFTAIARQDPETVVLDLVGCLHDQTHHGITFAVPAPEYYANPESCGAQIAYRHEWATAGRFEVQVSFRATPLLPVKAMPLRRERYFDWLGIDPPEVPALDLHEVVGEKIRAALQRRRVRDVFDLFQLARQWFDRGVVRRVAVLKCWESRWAFEPEAFLAALMASTYDWDDLRRLLRRGSVVPPDEIIRGVQQGFAFLLDLDADERVLSRDAHGREQKTYRRLVNRLRGE